MIDKYVKSIGEISIRVNDMDKMIDFYVHKLGFELRRRFENDVAAIKLADGVFGQVHTLTLFSKNLKGNFKSYAWIGLDNKHSPLHHFALTIDSAEYDELLKSLELIDIAYDVANHRWTGWRGVYIQDPEENIIEFVCYDEGYDDGKNNSYDFNKLHGAVNRKPFE